MDGKFSKLNYILVTPCKNEEKNTDRLIFSIKSQSIKPLLWVIINDNSNDKTKELILQHKSDFIALLDLKSNKSGIGLHLARVIRLGFHTALKIARLKNIKFNFIGLLDADMIPERTYFEKLMHQMNMKEIGIASGIVYSKINNKFIKENHKPYLPRGGARLWNIKCFIDTEGFLVTYSPDSVSIISAKLKGWKTKQCNNIKVFQIRETSSKNGLWKGYKIEGKSCYFRDFHPLYIILKSISILMKKPGLAAPAFITGYAQGYLLNIGKLNNKHIRDYYRYKKIEELI